MSVADWVDEVDVCSNGEWTANIEDIRRKTNMSRLGLVWEHEVTGRSRTRLCTVGDVSGVVGWCSCWG